MRAPAPKCLCCLLLPTTVCGLLLLCSLPSLLIARKIVALLVLPPGLLWLGLMALAGWPGLRAGGRCLAVLVLLAYTLTGNSWLGGWLLGRLESPYVALAQPARRFDAICVLGGGSSARPDGTPQLGPAGDRLVVPARMFHAGMTQYLVASGLNVTDSGGSRSLANDTGALWLDLGIPEKAIIRLNDPRTTKEEILAYKALIAAHSWQQVGVCSSAWHLRRVEAICRNEGMRMIPLPADFLSTRLPWNPMYAVPQARGFQNVQKALWEYLGSLTGG